MPKQPFLLTALTLLCLSVWQTAVSAPPHHTNAAPTITAVSIAGGFNRPTDIAHAGDNRLFVVEQAGVIKIIDENGATLTDPFLDINSIVDSVSHSERGLLGLAFHPDYPTIPYFYVNYTATGGGDTVIARYTVDAANANLADPSSAQEILRVSQPQENHNAGDLAFGPDGYLYITMGDGGGAGDDDTGHGTVGNGQDRQTLLGKILRIDVDGGTPYAIPPDNPFVADAGTLNEIWALGVRNPWRISFDRDAGDLYIADVGQGAWEEVNFQPASSTGGENYGWRCYEGLSSFNTSGCGPSSEYVFPFDDYPHNNSQNPDDAGLSITGGFVYRGSNYPELDGYYLYADFVLSNFWLAKQESSNWQITPIGQLSGVTNPSTFGEGCDGELYVAGYSGTIFQIQTTNTTSLSLLAEGETFIYLPFITNGSSGRCL